MRLLQIDPAAICLHYGQEVFEGLKAYAGKNGEIYLFRWQKNAERLQSSCKRLMMESVSSEFFGRAVKSLVLVDREWIPPSRVAPCISGRPSSLPILPRRQAGRRICLLHHRRPVVTTTLPASTRSRSGSPTTTCAP